MVITHKNVTIVSSFSYYLSNENNGNLSNLLSDRSHFQASKGAAGAWRAMSVSLPCVLSLCPFPVCQGQGCAGARDVPGPGMCRGWSEERRMCRLCLGASLHTQPRGALTGNAAHDSSQGPTCWSPGHLFG